MNCDLSEKSGYQIISLGGDVDLASSPEARKMILQGLAKGPALVDLSAVDYIDSSGVASLVEGYQEAKERGLTFALTGVSQSALLVLQLAHLDRVFTIHDTLEDAVSDG